MDHLLPIRRNLLTICQKVETDDHMTEINLTISTWKTSENGCWLTIRGGTRTGESVRSTGYHSSTWAMEVWDGYHIIKNPSSPARMWWCFSHWIHWHFQTYRRRREVSWPIASGIGPVNLLFCKFLSRIGVVSMTMTIGASKFHSLCPSAENTLTSM